MYIQVEVWMYVHTYILDHSLPGESLTRYVYGRAYAGVLGFLASTTVSNSTVMEHPRRIALLIPSLAPRPMPRR